MKRALTMLSLLLAAISMAAQETLPPCVDNSRSIYFPPVFTQIGGSCAQASSIGYMFTYEMNSLLDRPSSLESNRFSYLFTWNFLNDGIDQGSFGWDGIQLSYKSGIMSDADFPVQYSTSQFYWADGYDKYYRAMHYKAKAVISMDLGSEADIEALKSYLYNEGRGHLVIFSSGGSGWTFDSFYEGPSLSGYRCLLTSLPTDGSHAMTIVGYDDTVECRINGSTSYGAFIAVNSWGESSHDGGFYYLPYRFFLDPVPSGCLLSKSVSGLQVQYYEPRMTFKVNLDYSSRNDLSFYLGVADKPYSEEPSVQVATSIASNQGGDFPMQGRYAPSTIEMGFDASALSDALGGYTRPKFFLRVDRKEVGKPGEGRLLGYEVHDYEGGRVFTFDADGCGPFEWGTNLYPLATTPLHTTSANRVEWLTAAGKPVTSPLVVRTAKGRYAKIRITKKDNEISFKYVYAPDGSVSFGD